MNVSPAPDRVRSLVVLIDESVLCSEAGLRVDHNALESLLADVVSLWEDRYRCTLVISGQATVGRIRCGKLQGVPRQSRADVWAAVGRSQLDGWIGSRLGERGLRTGSLHLTRASFASREAYGAVRDCLRGLESNDAMPIVCDNGWMEQGSAQNDADQLMAMIAGQAGAEMAVVGLGEAVNLEHKGERLRSERLRIGDLEAGLHSGDLRILAPRRERFEGILAAARLLGALGIPLMVTGLKNPGALTAALQGTADGLIIEGDGAVPGRDGVKRWLSAGAIPQGTIVVSPYAATQLADAADRSSLLAAGVLETIGDFRENDVVAIEDESRRLLGFGLTKFGSREVAELRGQRNVIIVHADQFFGIGLRELVETDDTALGDSMAERT